jgi:hypothetical protein
VLLLWRAWGRRTGDIDAAGGIGARRLGMRSGRIGGGCAKKCRAENIVNGYDIANGCGLRSLTGSR